MATLLALRALPKKEKDTEEADSRPEVLRENAPLFWDLSRIRDERLRAARRAMGNGPFVALKVSDGDCKDAQIVHIIVQGQPDTYEVPGALLTHVTDERQGEKLGVRLLG